LNHREFQPGFRVSALDIGVLIAGVIGSALVGLQVPVLGVAIAFVVGHFFLFCNVLRMARPLELTWAAVFTIASIVTAATGFPGWPTTFAVAAIATVVLVFIQLRRPSYHGALWQRINPRLACYRRIRQ
jgi:uncharacterized membrane protein YtjA (UPF0391 family)